MVWKRFYCILLLLVFIFLLPMASLAASPVPTITKNPTKKAPQEEALRSFYVVSVRFMPGHDLIVD